MALEQRLTRLWETRPGLRGWLGTVDHKEIGVRYIEFSPGRNMDFWALGLILLSISTTAGAINFVVTIFKLRAPGMSIGRMPLFAWTLLATSFAIIFALPPLTVANIFLELDRRVGT